MGWNRLYLIVVASALAAGCAVQSHHVDGELISRSIEFRPARMTACDATKSSIVVTNALGVGVEDHGFKVGYMSEQRTCIPDDCKVVFWIDDPTMVDEVRARIGDVESVCMASRLGWGLS